MRNQSDGSWQCPVYEGIKRELESLNNGALIRDLDDLVQQIREQGVPRPGPDDPVVIHAASHSAAPSSSSAPNALSSVASNSSQSAAAAPQSAAQKAPSNIVGGQPVKHQKPAPAAPAPAPQERKQPAPVARPKVPEPVAAEDDYLPEPAPLASHVQEHEEFAEDEPEGLLVKMTTASSSDIVQEVNLHTGIECTTTSMTFWSTVSSDWLPQPMDIVAKLVPLVEGADRDRQLLMLNEAYRLHKFVNSLQHPNILSILAKEDIINSNGVDYCMALLEKADMNLANFFGTYLPTQIAFAAHKKFVSQVVRGEVPKATPLTKLWRSLYDQILSAYAALHKLMRSRQRPINPKNILVSLSPSGLPTQATIKVSDFPIIGLATVDEMPAYTALDLATLGVPYGIASSESGMKADLFSIGCVLYFIASGGEHLFDGPQQIQACHSDGSLQNFLKRHNVHKSDPLALDIIFRLTLPQPSKRDLLSVLRHHPATWPPALVIKNLCYLHNELTSNIFKSGTQALRQTLNSPSFFSFAFHKRTSWQGFVLPAWLSAWPKDASLPIAYDSVGCLLHLLNILASKMNNQVMLENFGLAIGRHLAYFIAALWSHVPQFGYFDEQHNIVLTSNA